MKTVTIASFYNGLISLWLCLETTHNATIYQLWYRSCAWQVETTFISVMYSRGRERTFATILTFGTRCTQRASIQLNVTNKKRCIYLSHILQKKTAMTLAARSYLMDKYHSVHGSKDHQMKAVCKIMKLFLTQICVWLK